MRNRECALNLSRTYLIQIDDYGKLNILTMKSVESLQEINVNGKLKRVFFRT